MVISLIWKHTEFTFHSWHSNHLGASVIEGCFPYCATSFFLTLRPRMISLFRAHWFLEDPKKAFSKAWKYMTFSLVFLGTYRPSPKPKSSELCGRITLMNGISLQVSISLGIWRTCHILLCLSFYRQNCLWFHQLFLVWHFKCSRHIALVF